MGIQDPVDVVGHSMGGLAALAYAIERPERTRRLVLVTSLSGFPAAARWGFPGSAFQMYERDYWRVIVWGIRLNAGRGDLALHKRLQNLMARASYYDQSLFTPVEIDADDTKKGVPSGEALAWMASGRAWPQAAGHGPAWSRTSLISKRWARTGLEQDEPDLETPVTARSRTSLISKCRSGTGLEQGRMLFPRWAMVPPS